MSTASVLTVRPGPYTVADLEAMPEDGQRYELIDGGLLVTPGPAPLHQRVTVRLVKLLDDHVARGFEALTPVDLDCGGDNVLQPDIVVLPSKIVDSGVRVVRAGDVLLVVEVVSPSSVRMDRVLKPQIYAEAGIPNYLLVELAEPKVTWFRRSATGMYAVHAEAAGDEPLLLTHPLGVEVTPLALVAPRD
jgi:Uma2 family endonuclease